LSRLRSEKGEVAGAREFVDTIALTRFWDEERLTEAVEKALLTESASLATIRFFLRENESKSEEREAALDYAGPRVTTPSVADYMGLIREACHV
jgi:hypothetical protein